MSGWRVTQCFLKHFFLSMSVKQNLSVSVFVHRCLMVLNDVEYATFKMFVTQISNYLFVISVQLMFYKTLRCSLARPSISHCQWKTWTNGMFNYHGCQGRQLQQKTLFSGEERLMENNYYWARIAQVNFLLMPVFRINSFLIMNKKVA